MSESWNSNSQTQDKPAEPGPFQGTAHNPGESVSVNPDTTVADQTEEQVEEVEEEIPEEDQIDTSRSNAGLFSWRDVALVSSFVQQYSAAGPDKKGLFQDLTQSYGDPIDIAQGIYPPNGVVHATDFIIKVSSGTQNATPSQAMRQGIELAATIGEMEVEEIRMVSKMINALLEHDVKDSESIVSIRYRRNMDTHEVLDLFMEAIDNIGDKGLEALQWARQLLSIWPESA